MEGVGEARGPAAPPGRMPPEGPPGLSLWLVRRLECLADLCRRRARHSGHPVLRRLWGAGARLQAAILPLRLAVQRSRLRSSFVGRWLDASALILLSVFLVTFLVNWLEPFGLGNASRAQSMRTSARAMAPFYSSEAQDRIAVVLIDDTTLHHTGMGWPPRYSDYEDLLRRVLAHQPRAVYLDVLLVDERHYDESLEPARAGIDALVRNSRRIDEAGGGPVPVFFGVGTPGQTSIFSAPGGVRDVIMAWEGVGENYPLRVTCERTNKMALGSGCEAAGAGPGAATVALALYQEACPEASSPGCREAASSFPVAAEQVPVAVQWGWRSPLEDDGSLAYACHDLQDRNRGADPPGWRTRTAIAGRLLWDSLRSGRDPDIENRTRNDCVYPFTVFAEQLSDARLLFDGDEPRPLLQDRVVFIGTHLFGLDDRVRTPVNQRVPGVYLHAMALDNLMTWGSRRIHQREGMDFPIVVATGVVMSALAGLLLCLRGRRVRLWWVLLAMSSVPAAGLAIVLVVQGVMRQPPQDWLGLALVAAVTLFVLLRPAMACGADPEEEADEDEDEGDRGARGNGDSGRTGQLAQPSPPRDAASAAGPGPG